MARITPVAPPYDPSTGELLTSMMPPGVPPIGLFRTFVRNPAMTTALRGWGGYELSPELSLTLRDREIVIDRVCARCDCEYEWGVHVAFFAERAGLDEDAVASLTHGSSRDRCWTDERDRALIDVVDELHETARMADPTYDRLAGILQDAQILDLLALAGWYHAICYLANGAEVDLEDGAPRFGHYAPPSAGTVD